MRILFMGTPDFALYSLAGIHDAGEEYEVIGVVTQEDKPRGRGYTLTPPPVKVWATEHGVPVYQPKTLKDGAFAADLQAIAPDLIVVTAYGKILPPYVLSYPKYGCINVHTSLLPRWRGAAPMQWALLSGDRETGVTIQQMDEGLDTGDILTVEKISIGEEDNLEVVHDRLGEASRRALCRTLHACSAGTLAPVKQPAEGMCYAPKIEKVHCVINFDEDAHTIHNRIRALSPAPLAFTHTPDGKLLKVVTAHVASEKPTKEAPGTVLSVEGGAITVACRTGSVALTAVLPEGKGRMAAADFIRGRKIAPGDVLA